MILRLHVWTLSGPDIPDTDVSHTFIFSIYPNALDFLDETEIFDKFAVDSYF